MNQQIVNPLDGHFPFSKELSAYLKTTNKYVLPLRSFCAYITLTYNLMSSVVIKNEFTLNVIYSASISFNGLGF